MSERLEEISNRIRMGTPVGVIEALEAIEYQALLRKEREEKSVIKKIKRWFRALINSLK